MNWIFADDHDLLGILEPNDTLVTRRMLPPWQENSTVCWRLGPSSCGPALVVSSLQRASGLSLPVPTM